MASKELDEFTSAPTTFIEPEGTSLKAALDVSRKYGAVLDGDLPFSGGSLFQGDAQVFYTKASRLKIASYTNLGASLTAWRRWLANNGPILVRLDVDRTWDNATAEPNLRVYQAGTARGGHAVALVGYTPEGFIVRNSWGEGWADKGFAYASNAYASVGFGAGKTYTGYYSASAAIWTDDKFKSEAYAAELVLDPPLPYIPYHRSYKALDRGGPVEVDFKWGAHFVADWIQVDDPGRRKELVDQAEYVRIGYDTGFDLRFGPADADWRFLLSADYGLRDGQTEDGGDAQLFSSSLLFLDGKETHWSFGLSYERGENLQSFEKSELWKLVFGARF